MAAANEARVAIRVDDQSRAGFDSFKRSMSDLEAGFGRLRSVAGAAFAVLAGGFGLREIATAGVEAEKSQARLIATLQATGYAAGLTQKQLEDLNEELVGLTEFDDESIRNAQAQLLKFGEIAGTNFERALKAAADFAAFTGTDLPAAAQAIGTALSNQEGGIGRLERQFGKLTKTEEDAIKALQDVGDVAGAQAAKLSVVEARIGGVAEKMNSGLTKSTRDLSKAWGDFLEEIARTDNVIGGTLNTALTNAANFFKNLRAEINGTKTDLSALIEQWPSFMRLPAQAALSAARAGTQSNVATGAIQPSAALAGRMGEEAQVAAAERARADKAAKEREEQEKKLRAAAGKSAEDARRALEAQRERGDRSYYDRLEALEQEYIDAGQRANEERLERNKELRALELKDAESYYARVAALEDQYVEQGQAANQERLDKLKDEANRSKDLARDLGLTFSSAFEDAISGGKGFREILKGIEQDLIKLGTRKLVTEKLFDVFSKGIGAAESGGMGGLMDFIGGLFSAKGNVFSPSGLVPFARGGVVAQPTIFPFARGVGMMGEAGPEAIMPLRRTASGDLGVVGSGGGVTVNISMSGGGDRRSAQQVAAEVGRAVARATRRNA